MSAMMTGAPRSERRDRRRADPFGPARAGIRDDMTGEPRARSARSAHRAARGRRSYGTGVRRISQWPAAGPAPRDRGRIDGREAAAAPIGNRPCGSGGVQRCASGPRDFRNCPGMARAMIRPVARRSRSAAGAATVRRHPARTGMPEAACAGSARRAPTGLANRSAKPPSGHGPKPDRPAVPARVTCRKRSARTPDRRPSFMLLVGDGCLTIDAESVGKPLSVPLRSSRRSRWPVVPGSDHACREGFGGQHGFHLPVPDLPDSVVPSPGRARCHASQVRRPAGRAFASSSRQRQVGSGGRARRA